ncbi:BREX-1 system adenine-specific DNA-methyltransferase PglX [Alcanivorax sp. DG881]|uniref:BREX-1 system adenine-specific DNA-methyltransferase PglX n=1 Tax=Alcanivorax sp. DG881 TaxID=236097 RepID=UPI0002E1B862|nr:BREX-1 system adenine-specific DNA-methyltransferase PglX [Alcanivorax sp. DG881]
MNKSALKKYAPQARLDFIATVTRRAELLGLNPESPAKVEKQGEALLINGRAFPAAYGQMRTTLEARIREQGFAQVMEAMAYTWFNRLVAVRYMELHGFLDHGYRVLSHPANTETGHTQPEILDHIADLDLPGLDKSVALELKLAGNKDEELYREVLLAQCHALHQAMPFLFESLDDATELLLPDGLLRTDSILGKLVTAIDEADWQDVEIIGWLYQFYISEKKDQVIGKVVKSEDIPAATQLFTPNWIVKYLVQNSLGRLWLMASPTSTLATKWEYYIQPADQTDKVNAQLDALIQTRIDEDGATLNPESLTLLDPACGSGHILVEAYDLLRDIYLERGYRRQDIPRLILEKNLYGLDIDDRAAQLAGFALLMKARADDRCLFGQPVALNLLALQEAKEGSAADLHSALNAPQIEYRKVSQLVETFEQAKTFGSLIQIPNELADTLPELKREIETIRGSGDLLGRDAAETLLKLVEQAEILDKKFDTVVANPPYMDSKGMGDDLKAWAKKTFPAGKSNLFAMFIERGFGWCKPAGFNSMVTLQSWMFQSTFSELRSRLLKKSTIDSLVQIGFNSFPELNSKVALGAAFSIFRSNVPFATGTFVNLNSAPRSADKGSVFRDRDDNIVFFVGQEAFQKIPDSPIAYWAPYERVFKYSPLNDFYESGGRCKTHNDENFVRFHWELESGSVGPNNRWRYYEKGGDFRKWYGNRLFVVDWSETARAYYARKGGLTREMYWNRQGITWSDIGIQSGFRLKLEDTEYSSVSPTIFPLGEKLDLRILLLLNSSLSKWVMSALNPGLHANPGEVLKLPNLLSGDPNTAEKAIHLAKDDWDSYEVSGEFSSSPLVQINSVSCRISDCARALIQGRQDRTNELRNLEEQNNKEIIDRLGLSDHVSPKVPLSEISLTGNLAYRGKGKNRSSGAEEHRKLVSEELASYAIGCMMGRYSLDTPGLIYAHAGNEGFDPSCYETFPADGDGIVPITDEAWFDDDGANRIREFVRVVWGEDTEAENMAWLAESLGSKASESADDTIRRYLSRDFYKDHLQTYKKRPIYWLFSSGKHKAFEALVYLHRYNAGTLSRMRMEYVVPLQSRMQARIDNLDQDIQASTSSAEQKRFQKQKDKLIKQLHELRRFDENLRHYADQRITLDLDDGVKANYGMFGDLLAEVKAVTGKKG